LSELKFFVKENNKFINRNVILSCEELSSIKLSKTKLLTALKLEEVYDQIIESFLEFKTQLYSNSLSLVNNFRIDYNANHEIRSKLNRQLFNTLNLSKLYLDKSYREYKDDKGNITKIKSFVKKITGDESLELMIGTFRTEIYSKSPEYNLGCALRNLTQHDTLPIQTYSVGINHDESEDNTAMRAKFHLPLSKENLLGSGIKRKLLEPFSEVIDLHEVMDEYIYSLSQMHMKNRELTKSSVEIAQKVFLLKAREIEEQHNDSQITISVYENEVRLFYLDLDWFEVVSYLQEKHAVEVNYRKTQHSTYTNP
jgi:hypothetical protein